MISGSNYFLTLSISSLYLYRIIEKEINNHKSYLKIRLTPKKK